ncbi:ubiquitin carboxyl-terminal hydrolase [Trifolium pratense]|uniref:Ubiquitin carboxyl-terminal hydrolase n=1 Tax=Trifolium pratense TaxID=57577 RepID=A0A2K3LC65_TRIPR|nr:ubiquitin carboxyl-terminal hydrolase [Trifolium pratense]
MIVDGVKKKKKKENKMLATVISPRCLQNRYGHLSIKRLNTLAKKEMVKGLPTLPDLDENCADCLTGKQHRDVIHKQATWRASMKLELVHSDICGPIKPASNG